MASQREPSLPDLVREEMAGMGAAGLSDGPGNGGNLDFLMDEGEGGGRSLDDLLTEAAAAEDVAEPAGEGTPAAPAAPAAAPAAPAAPAAAPAVGADGKPVVAADAPALGADGKPVEAAAAAAPAPAAVPEWKTIADVKVDELPEAVRPYVQAVHALAVARDEAARTRDAERDEELRVEREGIVALRTQFSGVLATLEGDPGKATQELFAHMEAAGAELAEMARNHVETTWLAFDARNKGYSKYADAVKTAFAEEIAHPEFRTRFRGKNDVERMEDALALTLHRQGVPRLPAKGAAAPATAAAAPAPTAAEVEATRVAAAAADLEARRQAAVSSGGEASNPGHRGIDEKTYDEILDSHEHLLEWLPPNRR